MKKAVFALAAVLALVVTASALGDDFLPTVAVPTDGTASFVLKSYSVS
jgi:hypothetical protein